MIGDPRLGKIISADPLASVSGPNLALTIGSDRLLLLLLAYILGWAAGWVPGPGSTVALDVGTVLLAMAMAALGMTTHISALKKAGVRPLLMALVLFIWLIVGGGLINVAIHHLLP